MLTVLCKTVQGECMTYSLATCVWVVLGPCARWKGVYLEVVLSQLTSWEWNRFVLNKIPHLPCSLTGHATGLETSGAGQVITWPLYWAALAHSTAKLFIHFTSTWPDHSNFASYAFACCITQSGSTNDHKMAVCNCNLRLSLTACSNSSATKGFIAGLHTLDIHVSITARSLWAWNVYLWAQISKTPIAWLHLLSNSLRLCVTVYNDVAIQWNLLYMKKNFLQHTFSLWNMKGKYARQWSYYVHVAFLFFLQFCSVHPWPWGKAEENW